MEEGVQPLALETDVLNGRELRVVGEADIQTDTQTQKHTQTEIDTQTRIQRESRQTETGTQGKKRDVRKERQRL